MSDTVVIKVKPPVRVVKVRSGPPGLPGRSVTDAEIDGAGHLVLSFSTGPDVDVGKVTGNDGDDGRAITDAEIDGSGHLVLTFSDTGPTDLGKVVGTNGADGRAITDAEIDGSGHLILTFSDTGPEDFGKVTGDDGNDGVSIIGAAVDGGYHLILSLSNGSTIDAGYVRGASGAGAGDVVGPAGTTTGYVAVFADGTGKLLAGVSLATFKTSLSLVKADVGLGNVDNTSDANKPVSTATQTALDLKAPLASPTFTGTVSGITKAMVSLGNVDNTSDANKPVSTAQQTALNLKAPLASPAFTGAPTAPTVSGTDNSTNIATTAQVQSALAAYIASQDIQVFKGFINCSANPSYPAADAGHVYRVSVAGKIGGASGPNVEVNDMLTCVVDGSSAGTQAAVGANWVVSQVNIDGAVTGPTSAVDATVAGFNGATGKIIKQLSAAEIRAAAALATSDSPQFTGIELGHATDTTLSRVAPGVAAIEGNIIPTVVSGVLTVPATSSGPSELRLREDTDNGTNHVGLKAPAILSADAVWEMPAIDGTNGQVLKTNGSKVLFFGDAGGGALEFVLAGTASGSASIDLTSMFSSSYDRYLFDFTRLYASASGNALYARLSINGGSSFISTSTYKQSAVQSITSSVSADGGATRNTALIGVMDDTLATGMMGNVSLVLDATRALILSNTHGFNGASITHTLGSASLDTASRVNGIQFYPFSGTLTGVYRVYRVKNS